MLLKKVDLDKNTKQSIIGITINNPNEVEIKSISQIGNLACINEKTYFVSENYKEWYVFEGVNNEQLAVNIIKFSNESFDKGKEVGSYYDENVMR